MKFLKKQVYKLNTGWPWPLGPWTDTKSFEAT